MAEETKTVSIRLPQDAIDYLADKGDSVTKQIMQVVADHMVLTKYKDTITDEYSVVMFNYDVSRFMERVQTERKIALDELRGVFTPEEWQWLAASLNGIMTDACLRYSKDAFIYHCEDYQKYNPGEASQWPDVTPEGIAKKVEHLSALHISAIYDRCADFWNNSTKIDLSVWSKF